MNTSKKQLRQQLIAQRLSMAETEAAANSLLIANRFMDSVDWSKIRNMHIYRSVAAWKEVDTGVITQKISQEYPRLKIQFASLDKDAPLPDDSFDLIVVPVLGFDKTNYRLGLGGGWYDRFLAAQPQALKFGLAFQAGYVEGYLPNEPHDIPLDRVITEV